jgi:hypothetical protein
MQGRIETRRCAASSDGGVLYEYVNDEGVTQTMSDNNGSHRGFWC